MFELILDNLSYVRSKIVLLKAVNCRVKAGSINIITGSTRSGKTLLCNLLTGKLEPTTGSVEVSGSIKTLATFIDVSFPAAQPIGITVHEWLAIWSENWRIPLLKLTNVIADVYPSVNHLLSRHCETLSSTEFYCIEVCRHQLAPAACVIFDDAHLPLDKETREVQKRVFDTIKGNDRAVLLLLPLEYAFKYPIIYNLNESAVVQSVKAVNGKLKLQLDGPTYRLKRYIQDGSISVRFITTDVIEINQDSNVEEILNTINNLGIDWSHIE